MEDEEFRWMGGWIDLRVWNRWMDNELVNEWRMDG